MGVQMNRRTLSTIIAVLLIAPTIATLAQAVLQAQWIPGSSVIIRRIYPGEYVYPDETITVEIEAGRAGRLYLIVANSSEYGSWYEWNRTVVDIPAPGYYNVTIGVPLQLPYLDPNTMRAHVIVFMLGDVTYYNKSLLVYPKIVVSPSRTTIVTPTSDGGYTSNKIKVSGYGFDPGATVQPVIDGIVVANSTTVDENGTWSLDVDLLAVTGYGLPRGSHVVSANWAPVGAESGYEIRAANIKTGTFEVVPQAIITPTEGHGRCDGEICELESIEIVGFGFNANASVTAIKLINSNFTNVVYTFPLSGVSTNTYGYFEVTNLAQFLRTNMSAGLYTLSVTTGSEEFAFGNVYYLVRPLLVIVEPLGTLRPNDTVTIAAYGYGPERPWLSVTDNRLTITFDGLQLRTVDLGSEGNATFTVTIPSNATYGSHSIRGVDSWGYEQSLTVIVGARAYWVKLDEPINVPRVSAGYNNTRIEIRPCQTVIGIGYCGRCVVYNISSKFDYLGDRIKVIVAGLSPGDTVTIYFGDRAVKEAAANASGMVEVEFVVPSVPAGSYEISIQTPRETITPDQILFFDGESYVTDVMPEVVPKVLLTTLDGYLPVMVGAGIVKVIGTGFPPGTMFAAVLVNGTDALMFLSQNMWYLWTTDESGTLISMFVLPDGRYAEPALFIPMMEPGLYAISLVYWNGTSWVASEPGYVYVVNNISIMATKDDVASVAFNVASILAALSDINASLSRQLTEATNLLVWLLNGISSQIAELQLTLIDAITGVTTSIDSAVASLSALITDTSSSIMDRLTAVNSSIISAITANSAALSSKIDTVLSKIDALSSDIREALTTISTSLNNIATSINEINATLATVVIKVDAATKAVADVSSVVNVLSGKVDSLSSAVSGLSGKVDALSSKVDSISNSVNTVSGKVDVLSGKVDSISNTISSVSGKVDALSGKVDSLSSAVSGLSGAVNALGDKVDSVSRAVSDVGSAVSVLSGRVDALNGTVGTLANTVSGLNNTVNSISNAVADLSSKVNTVNSTVSSLSDKVDALNGKVSDISTSVSSTINKLDVVSGSVGTLQTYILVTLVLALIGAVAGIFAVVQLSRKLAG